MAKKKTDAETDGAEKAQVLSDRLVIIRRQQTEIDKADKVIADLKEDLKDAKDNWKGLVFKLGTLIRGELPLFEDADE